MDTQRSAPGEVLEEVSLTWYIVAHYTVVIHGVHVYTILGEQPDYAGYKLMLRRHEYGWWMIVGQIARPHPIGRDKGQALRLAICIHEDVLDRISTRALPPDDGL